MAELKTKQTEASVEKYLDTIEDPRRRADCAAISALMKKVTKFEPKMWGPSIVGFGSYHYRYETGHEGDACLAGFSSRNQRLSSTLRMDSKHAGVPATAWKAQDGQGLPLHQKTFRHRRRSPRETRQNVSGGGEKTIPVVRATPTTRSTGPATAG